MSGLLKTKDITNQIYKNKTKKLTNLSLFQNTFNPDGVGISTENIKILRNLITHLLKESKSMIITNKNLNLNKKNPNLTLRIEPKELKMLIKQVKINLCYKFNIDDNTLLLNNKPANELEANEFNTFFNSIILNMVNEGYEVIKDEL